MIIKNGKFLDITLCFRSSKTAKTIDLSIG